MQLEWSAVQVLDDAEATVTKVARLHLDSLGARLTELRPEQAAYLGIPVQGPYKPDHYRY